jgi:hypothetical protein
MKQRPIIKTKRQKPGQSLGETMAEIIRRTLS